jgi:TPP-dependent pyruvate/acetoin dehydrogenase alpha subunit
MNQEHAYRSIALIRRFEERLVELKAAGKIQGSMHLCSGQEAIPVGSCTAIGDQDALMVTYRGHGWAIARGLPLRDLFA